MKRCSSAEPANQLMTRAQVQVIGIGKNDLRVQLFEQMLGDGLDRPCGAHRHEGRSLDQPMGKCYGRPPCLSTDGFYLKSERHWLILTWIFHPATDPALSISDGPRVPHISLVFREMWDTTNLQTLSFRLPMGS